VITFVLALVIFALVASWLSITSTRMSKANLVRDRYQVAYTAEAGISKALWYLAGNGDKNAGWRTCEGTEDSPFDETPFQARSDQCEISVADQGGYLLVSSQGKSGKTNKRIEACLGVEIPENFDLALYVGTSNSLILTSGSAVRGGILSGGPVKYSGGNIEGTVRKGALPAFQSLAFDRTITQFHDILTNPYKATKEYFSPQVFDGSGKAEFPSGRGVFFVNDAILFQGGTLDSPLVFEGRGTLVSTAEIQISGNVALSGLTLITSGPIKVMERAKLTDCLLYSETSVTLQEEASFQGQIVSLQDISVTDKAVVRYPSVLYSSGVLQGKTAKGTISISGDAVVNGVVISHSQSSLPENEVGMDLDERAVVNGLVYAMNRARIRGRVNGIAMARILWEEPYYPDTLNHNLLKGTVDRTQLPPDFALPQGFSDKPVFKILAWKET
jgi:hypothetical protein